MKLFKLSLVAAVAAGAFSTASAVALEEAIKDVDVSGWAFVRYQASNYKNNGDGDWWKYKAIINAKTKIDDHFFFLAGIRYGAGADKDLSSAGSGGSTSNPQAAGRKFMLNQILLGYNIGGTTITAGRYVLGTFFTADMYGDGIKIVNTDIQGLTLAALFADALEQDGDAYSRKLGAVNGKTTTDHNLYGVAAIGSYDPVSFQLWYAYLEDVTKLFAAELAFNFNVMDDFGIGLKGQYGFSDFDGEFKDATLAAGTPVTDSKFAAGEASIKPFGAELSAGYVYYKAKDGGISVSSFEDNGGFISAGEVLVSQQELMSYSGYIGKNDYWFVKAGYKIPGTGLKISADYVDGKFTGMNEGRVKANEWVGRINYAYNKHLDFTTYYSEVKFKDAATVITGTNDIATMTKDKVQTVRVNARYKF